MLSHRAGHGFFGPADLLSHAMARGQAPPAQDKKAGRWAGLQALESLRGLDGNFTLRLRWGSRAAEPQTNCIWRQSSNPANETHIAGYRAVHVPTWLSAAGFEGLRPGAPDALLLGGGGGGQSAPGANPTAALAPSLPPPPPLRPRAPFVRARGHRA